MKDYARLYVTLFICAVYIWYYFCKFELITNDNLNNMKKTFLLFALLAATSLGHAQTSVETLKKDLATSKTENQKLKDENNFLNEKLNLCNALTNDTVTQVKSFSDLYSVRVASCKGDRVSQTVKIDLMLNHKTVNQKLSVNYFYSNVVNSLGEQLKLDYNYSADYYNVYTNIPTRISITVKNVLPGTDMFSMLALQMSTCPIDEAKYNPEFTEIRNLKIVW